MRAVVLVVALSLSLGCTFNVGSEGLMWNVGQSSLSTCGPIPEAGADPLATPPPEDCTVVHGAPLSEQGKGFFVGLFSAVGAVASGLLGGFGGAAAK